jgi:hypothetical protein
MDFELIFRDQVDGSNPFAPTTLSRDFWISLHDYFDKLTASTGSLTNPRSDLAGGRMPCQKFPELTCQNFWNPLQNALRFKNSDGR